MTVFSSYLAKLLTYHVNYLHFWANYYCLQIAKYWKNYLAICGQSYKQFINKHWSSSYGRRHMLQRLWVWNPAPYTRWSFFTFVFVVKKLMCLERRKMKKSPGLARGNNQTKARFKPTLPPPPRSLGRRRRWQFWIPVWI